MRVINHCENLVITPCIREFTALVGLTMCHSSTATWTSDAILSDTNHLKLRALTFADATMANAWTTSVNANDMPRALVMLDLCGGGSSANGGWENLDSIAAFWLGLTYLYLESIGLIDVSASVTTTLQLDELSLRGNAIQSVPPALLENNELI